MLIYSEKSPLVTVPRGMRCAMPYPIYCLRPADVDRPLEPDSRLYQTTQYPLRVRVAK